VLPTGKREGKDAMPGRSLLGIRSQEEKECKGEPSLSATGDFLSRKEAKPALPES